MLFDNNLKSFRSSSKKIYRSLFHSSRAFIWAMYELCALRSDNEYRFLGYSDVGPKIIKVQRENKKNTEWFIYTKIFQMCVHLKKRCRFVFYSARAFIWGITWPYATSISFLYLHGSCLARIIGKTRPRPFWWPPAPVELCCKWNQAKYRQGSTYSQSFITKSWVVPSNKLLHKGFYPSPLQVWNIQVADTIL